MKAYSFIKYCQEHSQTIDEYAIDTYGKYALRINNQIMIDLIFSNNYLYFVYTVTDRQYTFKFKNRQTINKLTKYYNPVNLKIAEIYKFDYENNENVTIINGHRLKSFCEASRNLDETHWIYTYDSESDLSLTYVCSDDVIVNTYIQEIIGECKELENFSDKDGTWDITDNIPERIKDLVISQKVIISMFGE